MVSSWGSGLVGSRPPLAHRGRTPPHPQLLVQSYPNALAKTLRSLGEIIGATTSDIPSGLVSTTGIAQRLLNGKTRKEVGERGKRIARSARRTHFTHGSKTVEETKGRYGSVWTLTLNDGATHH